MSDDDRELTRLAGYIYQKMYSTSRSAHEDVISNYYAQDAVFSDPIVMVTGKSDVGAQFIGLEALFSSITNKVHGVSVFPTYSPPWDDPTALPVTDATRRFAIVHATSTFTTSVGVSIPVRTFTQFEFRNVEEKGPARWVVVRHEDTWSVWDLMLPITVMKAANTWWRRVFGRGSSEWITRFAGVLDGGKEKGTVEAAK
ncbi:hypothetical protein M427DRAFT_50494 [Gonapodya prolifera JEL478]|uniref:SnoaL-like domain-containing protein n=1 Tax=Gonapodya prolifera (strain JEL478) TaxID=1344416 RepID=A0A139B006_GONPJ|nr:hypothetical protein M427DRAFT_50494 [Gonapodya prolifera JEL478]|eukprot:KXS22133.1 hypothetical protein M427DRAFT_50494 [Gonapodya prolifera JEL478]